MEDPLFIRLNIAHYRALLGTRLADSARSTLISLLRQAEEDLAALAPTSLGIPPAKSKRRSDQHKQAS